MKGEYRIVRTLPLDTLWDETGRDIPARKVRPVTREDIRELLRVRPLRFVLANCGHQLRWDDAEERFAFWKSNVQAHLAEETRPPWTTIQTGTSIPHLSGISGMGARWCC